MLRRNAGCGRRFAVGSVLLTTLAVAATGCSSAGSSSHASASGSPTLSSTSLSSTSSSSAAPTTPPAPPTTTSAPSVPPVPTTPTTSQSVSQSSGSYLKTLLPGDPTEALLGLGPRLPTGWTAQPTDEHDSGPAPTAAAPSLVGAGDCNYLITKDLDLAGGLSVGTATETIGVGSAGVGAAFYAYPPGDAAKSLAQVRQNLAASCDGFTAMMDVGAVTVDVSATPVSGLGDEALLVKLTPQGPYIAQEDLLVRRGNLMLSLWSNNVFGSMPDLTPGAAAMVTGMG